MLAIQQGPFLAWYVLSFETTSQIPKITMSMSGPGHHPGLFQGCHQLGMIGPQGQNGASLEPLVVRLTGHCLPRYMAVIVVMWSMCLSLFCTFLAKGRVAASCQRPVRAIPARTLS